MAIAQQYPLGTPKTNDLLVGTSIPDPNTNDDPITKNFSVSDVIALVPYRGTVESVGLNMDGNAVVVNNSPVTSIGTLDISWIGDSSQYVNGEGDLVAFPDIPFTSLTTTGTGAATLAAGVLNIPTPQIPDAITLTTNGTSGASTLTGGVLNIPQYSGGGLTGSGTIGSLPIWTGTSELGNTSALVLNANGELTIPFYATPTRRNTSGLAFDAVTGKIIPADSPNYTRGENIIASSGGSTTLDIDTPGIVSLSWLFNGVDGTFTVNLPDILSPSANFNYFNNRKFKFVFNQTFSAGRDVVLTPFSTQQINGAASYTIPSAAYNVVEIWNRGGEWIIISKLIN